MARESASGAYAIDRMADVEASASAKWADDGSQVVSLVRATVGNE
jgi:hypothetical protein